MSKTVIAQKDAEIARLRAELDLARAERDIQRAEKETHRAEKETLRTEKSILRSELDALLVAAAAAPAPAPKPVRSKSPKQASSGGAAAAAAAAVAPEEDPAATDSLAPAPAQTQTFYFSTRERSLGIKKGLGGHISVIASEEPAAWQVKKVESGLQAGCLEFFCQEAITPGMVLDRYKGGEGTDEVCVYRSHHEGHIRKGGNVNQRWREFRTPSGSFFSPVSDPRLFLKISEDGRLICAQGQGDLFNLVPTPSSA
jgi:hypothetical protein